MNKDNQKNNDLNDCYFLMRFQQLKLVFEMCSCYHICETGNLTSYFATVMIFFVIKCFYRGSSESFFTSPVVNHKKYENKPHEVNMRSVTAFREFLKFLNC